jgi:hypothetical protein
MDEQKSTVEGPYRGPFNDLPHYVVRLPAGYAVVAEGRQPGEGILHPDRRSARAHLRRNGFEAP